MKCFRPNIGELRRTVQVDDLGRDSTRGHRVHPKVDPKMKHALVSLRVNIVLVKLPPLDSNPYVVPLEATLPRTSLTEPGIPSFPAENIAGVFYRFF